MNSNRPFAANLIAAGFILLVANISALPCEGAEASGPFKAPRETIMQNVKTIGVMPLVLPGFVPNPDDVAARYETAIAASLQAAGFSVVQPSAMRDIRERLKKTMGGLYDPMTGLPIPDKVKSYNDYADSEYQSKYRTDATLRMSVVQRSASGGVATVTWDGVTDSSSGRSVLTSVLSLSGGVVSALSFYVRLTDSNGKEMYSNFGGLQVLAYARGGQVGSKLQPIDARYIMTDPARDERARAIALGPLLGVSDPAAMTNIAYVPAAISTELPALRISRRELLSKYKKVALAPLELPQAAQRPEVQARYLQAIEKKLALLGFTVLGGDTYGGLWQTERASDGGFFDPFTGKRDESRLRDARARVFAQMQERFGISSTVYPAIVTRAAQFTGGSAWWDGTEDRVNADNTYSGELLAISLEVTIANAAGDTLFIESGGIQVVTQISGGAICFIPEAEYFTKPAKDARAVEIAFAPLVYKQTAD